MGWPAVPCRSVVESAAAGWNVVTGCVYSMLRNKSVSNEHIQLDAGTQHEPKSVLLSNDIIISGSGHKVPIQCIHVAVQGVDDFVFLDGTPAARTGGRSKKAELVGPLHCRHHNDAKFQVWC